MRVRGVFLSRGVAKIVEIDVDKPKRNEVLVETKACGICMGDIYVFRGKLPGGRVLGHEGVGIVAETGEEVENVKRGDKVTTLGGPAFAEFYKTDCRSVAKVPDDADDLAYWISEPAACVVNGIRGSAIEIGDNVCLIGCGYMGLLMIQAMPRTCISSLAAVDIRDEPLKLAKEFGAEFVVNSREVDAVKEVRDIFGGDADVVIEASGAPGTIQLGTELVRKGGKLIIFGRHVMDEKVPTEMWHTNGLNVINTAPNSSLNFRKDFHDAVKLIKKGVFNQKPLITHRYSCKDAQRAFEFVSQRPADYIKGVVTF